MNEKQLSFEGTMMMVDGDRWIRFEDLSDFILEQQTTISRLEKENKQLRKKLDDFKPVIFSDMQKGTVILYSKRDIDE